MFEIEITVRKMCTCPRWPAENPDTPLDSTFQIQATARSCTCKARDVDALEKIGQNQSKYLPTISI